MNGQRRGMVSLSLFVLFVRTEDAQFHQDQKIAWEYLGTTERMDELGTLMQQATQQASTDLERRRVRLWEVGVWEYMKAGKAQYESDAEKSGEN